MNGLSISRRLPCASRHMPVGHANLELPLTMVADSLSASIRSPPAPQNPMPASDLRVALHFTSLQTSAGKAFFCCSRVHHSCEAHTLDLMCGPFDAAHITLLRRLLVGVAFLVDSLGGVGVPCLRSCSTPMPVSSSSDSSHCHARCLPAFQMAGLSRAASVVLFDVLTLRLFAASLCLSTHRYDRRCPSSSPVSISA